MNAKDGREIKIKCLEQKAKISGRDLQGPQRVNLYFRLLIFS